MFKQMAVKLGKVTAALALYTGKRSVNVACSGPYYQPEVPEKMKKKSSGDMSRGK